MKIRRGDVQDIWQDKKRKGKQARELEKKRSAFETNTDSDRVISVAGTRCNVTDKRSENPEKLICLPSQ